MSVFDSTLVGWLAARSRQGVSSVAVVLLLSPGSVAAATYSLPTAFGTAPFNNCTWSSGTASATCSGDLFVGNNDTVSFDASMTVNVAGSFTVGNSSILANSGGYAVSVVAGGNIAIGNTLTSAIDFTAGGNVQVGNNGTIDGNIIAGGSISLGIGTVVNGNCTPTHAQCTNQCTSSTTGSITTVTCTGNGSFKAPSGVTLALVEAWGGGGGGGAATGYPDKGGGGAGGQYAYKPVTVSPGTTYPVVVGAGGAGGSGSAGSAGGDSTFNTNTVVAKGGAGGGYAGSNGGDGASASGSTTGGVGETVYRGGNSSAGNSSGSACNDGGSGGGGAGSSGNGGNASGNTAGTGTPTGGGNGGAGSNSSGNGVTGSDYGGGGAGACAESTTNRTGGAGGDGLVVITYSTSTPAPLADWRLDEPSWSGVANEVLDSSGNNNHGRARIAAGATPLPTTVSGSPAYTVGGNSTCNYGQFDSISGTTRTYTYVELSNMPTLPSSFTFAAWIRSTDPSAQHQRILVRDDADNGWGLSLADGTGQAKLRFFNRNIINSGSVSGQGSDPACGVFCLDTNAVITANNWHYIAAAIDTAGKTVTLYVYSSTGALLAKTSSAFSGTWADGTGTAAIGGETSASLEGQQTSWHFLGNIDEVQVYSGVLAQATIQTLLPRVRNCPSAVDHYEVAVPANNLACVASTVTVKACADTSSPCTNKATTMNGTATLATSVGSLGTSSLSFSSGEASTTLSYPAASNGATATLTLSGESAAAASARTCCVGSTCSASNTCVATFNTAGFIVTTAADGTTQTIASQTAGTDSAKHYLRAVQTSFTTKACEAALTGSNAVTLGYVCNNPASCSSGSYLKVTPYNGATAQATLTVPAAGSGMTLYFDANGNAPLTFNYLDVGNINLTASKTAGGSLLTALAGTSAAFVVKPAGFTVTATSPSINTANPYVAAGESFTGTIEARNSLGNATPNFGRESPAEGIGLAPAVTTPAGGANGTVSGSVNALTSGAGTGTFSWNEAGIANLTPEVADGNYLGAGNVTGTTIAAGRFYPHHFAIAPGGLTAGCNAGGFSYMGQPFSFHATVEARSTANSTTGGTAGITTNYGKTGYSPVQGSGLSVVAENAASGTDLGSRITTTPSPLTLNWATTANGTASAGTVGSPVSATFSRTTMDGPYDSLNIGLKLAQTDNGKSIATVGNMLSASAGGVSLSATKQRYGRLKLQNVFGSELIGLSMPVTTQYCMAGCSGSTPTWGTNTLDTSTCTAMGSGTLNLAYTGNLNGTNYPASKINAASLANGSGSLWLTAPSGGATGAAVLTSNQGWLPGSGVATFGIYTQSGNAGRIIHRREVR